MTQMSEVKTASEVLSDTIQTLKSDMQKNEEQINRLAADIADEQQQLEKMQRREKAFALFCKEYETYTMCMEM